MIGIGASSCGRPSSVSPLLAFLLPDRHPLPSLGFLQRQRRPLDDGAAISSTTPDGDNHSDGDSDLLPDRDRLPYGSLFSSSQYMCLLNCTMSDKNVIDVKEPEIVPSDEGTEQADHNAPNSMPSYEEEEEAMKKKYGGLLPKKKPLIAKDNERAFFDSADWALGKQGAPVEKPKGPLEALRPKLQPTHQQVRSRRSAYAPADGEDGANAPPEDLNNNE